MPPCTEAVPGAKGSRPIKQRPKNSVVDLRLDKLTVRDGRAFLKTKCRPVDDLRDTIIRAFTKAKTSSVKLIRFLPHDLGKGRSVVSYEMREMLEFLLCLYRQIWPMRTAPAANGR